MLLKKAAQVEPDDFQTVLALGQLYRVESWKGRDGFRELAEEALTYYKQAMELSPYDPVSPLGYGMCLDWLGRTEEATPFFEKASQLDPNGYETINYLGWHYLQMEDYVAAKSAFERVMRRWYTPMGAYYIGYINAKLREASQKQK